MFSLDFTNVEDVCFLPLMEVLMFTVDPDHRYKQWTNVLPIEPATK